MSVEPLIDLWKRQASPGVARAVGADIGKVLAEADRQRDDDA